MALLKKSSKGATVKELQTHLNKAGAKPELAVDGIFGPLTDKAVRKYQSKNGLKADGKAGEYTLATLKYGGKLPEMKVVDYKGKKDQRNSAKESFRKRFTGLITMQSKSQQFQEKISKEMENINTHIDKYYLFHDHSQKLLEKIVGKQSEFQSLLTKSPKKAQKLAGECKALDVTIRKHVELTLREEKIVNDSSDAIKESIGVIMKQFQSALDILKKK